MFSPRGTTTLSLVLVLPYGKTTLNLRRTTQLHKDPVGVPNADDEYPAAPKQWVPRTSGGPMLIATDLDVIACRLDAVEGEHTGLSLCAG